MDQVQINYGAVGAAALLSFVIGGLWYSPILFAQSWMREAGLDEAQTRSANMAKVFGLSFICSIVMALNLAAFIGAKASLGFGVFAGAATGIGWVAMSLAVIYLFEQRSLRLWLINSGYQVVSYTAMGAVIGAWK
ncbi:DUF1761 domain-containing protein [Piscinibacter terrae]|uniref:DUF1761 domain-containing protein n=1 Tax=Piscinibacter terrae TaxID=2496871 RepID=A0A3N7HRE8_9BURK|nr:DUF1761 domain-containing protein [Albitalea terrae]RQP24827.1 DUF1761 domain-containing protein [Albitalea terrae]